MWNSKNIPDRLYAELLKYKHLVHHSSKEHKRFKGIRKYRKGEPAGRMVKA